MVEIYKGKKYTITTDGIIAEKSDGNTLRKMKYYPERDIMAIAGEIDELTAWKILKDVALQSQKVKTPISPEHVLIDGNKFILSDWSDSGDERFIAPEGYSPVWALAATVFYVYLGCYVFHGLGGKGQTATAPIPILRRELPGLSNLVVKCLDFNPENRPDISEIVQIAEENIRRCEPLQNDFPPLKKIYDTMITADEIETYWPEEMC